MYGDTTLTFSGVEKLIGVPLASGSWFHESEDLDPSFRSEKATREEIMTVLSNIEYILIKLVYTLIILAPHSSVAYPVCEEGKNEALKAFLPLL